MPTLKLEMEVIPSVIRCEECGSEFNDYQFDLQCLHCHRKMVTTLLSGRELMSKEIPGYKASATM